MGKRTTFIAAACAAAMSAAGCVTAGDQSFSRRDDDTTSVFCAGQRLPLITAIGGSAPYVKLQLAGKEGLFLIDYGASQSVIEDGVWQLPPKGPPGWTQLSTPTGSIDLVPLGPHNIPGWTSIPKLNFQVTDRNITVPGRGPQIGVLSHGDLFFNQSLEFHYDDPADEHVIISAFGADCSGDALEAAGFKRIRQEGHWAAGGVAPNGVHNGPVAYIRFVQGGATDAATSVRTFAQLDTGLDDLAAPFTIVVNQALLAQLNSSAVRPVRLASIDIIDCMGSGQRQDVYSLPGHLVRIEDESGRTIHVVPNFHLVHSVAGEGCHGISEFDKPAAQLSASFLRDFGTTIFMGQTKEVWIRPSAAAR